ncbi:fungal cellulose binding domain containing protein, partial [Pyrenophora tritici-repentis]
EPSELLASAQLAEQANWLSSLSLLIDICAYKPGVGLCASKWAQEPENPPAVILASPQPEEAAKSVAKTPMSNMVTPPLQKPEDNMSVSKVIYTPTIGTTTPPVSSSPTPQMSHTSMKTSKWTSKLIDRCTGPAADDESP